jgi:hypothetical protein
MKKFLLCLLLFVSANLVFAQTPCPIDYSLNNGGGNCPDTVINGVTVTATGTVTLTFDGPVEPNNIPAITFVQETTTNPPVILTGISFGRGSLNNNGTVTYCYYTGPNNNNNLQGRNRTFRFFVFYNGGVPCGSNIPLPISLRTFTATRSNSMVLIKWITATEINNAGFEVQRLVGNGNWLSLQYIPSQAAGGNSSTDLMYTYTDLNNTKGITQYRLKQSDIDNKYKYSEIRSVRGEGQLGKTIIYPNPSNNGKVNVVFEDALVTREVTVSDISGRSVRQVRSITSNSLTLENLQPGMYTLRIVAIETGEQVLEKIVVNK